jgi:hypothetical protein
MYTCDWAELFNLARKEPIISENIVFIAQRKMLLSRNIVGKPIIESEKPIQLVGVL